MTEPGRRWLLDNAIESSGLPVPTPHLLHTLLRRADTQTGLIPDRFMPSLVTLRQRTGMRNEVLLRELDRAEQLGWLERERSKGGRGRRSHYKITMPETSPAPGPVLAMPETGLDAGPVYSGNPSGTRTGKGPETGPAPGPRLDQRVRSSIDAREDAARVARDYLAEDQANDDEIHELLNSYAGRGARNLAALVTSLGQKGDLQRDLAELRIRRPEPKPPWCGNCNEKTRLVEHGDIVTRCRACHPLTQ